MSKPAVDPFMRDAPRLLDIEGGYVNNPNDKGGETLFGISRVYNPQWDGWRLVDSLRPRSPANTALFIATIESSKVLKQKALDFYRREFYTPVMPASAAGRVDGVIASELFDQAVHFGPRRAVRHLQRVLNVLNRRADLWDDIVTDGLMGPATRRTYAEAVRLGNQLHIIRGLDILQGAYLFGRIEVDESQEAFTRGWFARVFHPHN